MSYLKCLKRMSSPLMEKQVATGTRKKLSNSLPNALKFKSSVLDSHLGGILVITTMSENCFILTSQVKSTENPTVSNAGNVYCT